MEKTKTLYIKPRSLGMTTYVCARFLANAVPEGRSVQIAGDTYTAQAIMDEAKKLLPWWLMDDVKNMVMQR